MAENTTSEESTLSTDEQTQTTQEEETTQTSQDQEQNADTNTEKNSDDENSNDDKTDDDNEEESKALDQEFDSVKDSSGGMYDIEDLTKAVAKVEAKLEAAEKDQKVDTKAFYKNLDKYLSKEEMELRFDDETQADYYEAVEKAKEKYIQQNTKPIEDIKTELQTEQEKLLVAKAIDNTLKKYPDYNHVKLAKFYTEKLTKEEQRKLDKGSTFDNLPEYFEKIYKLYKQKYPTKVQDKKAPELPDLSTKSKQTVDDEINIKQKEDDKKYMEQAGFRKL